ncbi:TRAP transporter large permease [Mesorhizobium sp. J428]|uniref:TRAP transporter large permease n=1 Tax=Mesorhizobium sp. J428 TaxID=2898440 RepID=UPI002150F491|nr:TRAP transporter large permease [Mesorhizobium sp. J428]MCR5855478.1 TRAP transporter large permease [Mesorhizobium sp. J428]
MELAALLISFVFLLLLGTSVAAAMILSAFLSLLLNKMPLTVMGELMLSGINSYTLLAVPFFIFAAVIMNRGGLTDRLLDVAAAFVGHFRGGTAQIDVLASVFFAGMSGSATADAASQGRILIPHMIKEGYDPGFAAGVNSSSATIGAIIPPSITMVIYGGVTNISVGALFLGGVVPGLLIGLALMVMVAILATRRGYPRRAYMPWKERWKPIVVALPALLAPVIILGGIFSGVTTPTEAGVVACLYGLILGFFVYGELKLKDIGPLLVETVEATAVPVYIIAASSVFGFALTMSGFGMLVQEWLMGFITGPTSFLLVVVTIFMLVGLAVEGVAAMLIFVPLFMPMVQTFHVDELQFAIIVIITLLLGTISPPVGLQLFIAADIAKISAFKVDIWPFIWIMLLVVIAIVFLPGLVTWLPGVIM